MFFQQWGHKKYLALLAIFVLLVSALGGTVLFAQKKAEAKIEQELVETMASFEADLEERVTLFNQYILDDYLQAYEELLAQGEEIVTQRQTEQIREYWRNLSRLEGKIWEDNQALLESSLKELSQEDMSRASIGELKDIESLTSEVESLILDKKFLVAKDILHQLEDTVAIITVEHDNLHIALDQVDTSDYPKVKLYLSIKELANNQVPQGLGKEFFCLSEKLSSHNEFIKKEITRVMQLNQHESLNINIVADMTSSMEGELLDGAKNAMGHFLDNIQFGVGDQLQLTAFADEISSLDEFTGDKQVIKEAINNLQPGGENHLYDALVLAINKTAGQSGARCVIAFTSARDTNSQNTLDDVLNLAWSYKIPVFMIGIGDEIDEAALQSLGESSRGFYANINNIDDLEGIYNKIYKEEKEIYLLEYQVTDTNQTIEARDIKIDIQSRKVGGSSVHTFVPEG